MIQHRTGVEEITLPIMPTPAFGNYHQDPADHSRQGEAAEPVPCKTRQTEPVLYDRTQDLADCGLQGVAAEPTRARPMKTRDWEDEADDDDRCDQRGRVGEEGNRGLAYHAYEVGCTRRPRGTKMDMRGEGRRFTDQPARPREGDFLEARSSRGSCTIHTT